METIDLGAEGTGTGTGTGTELPRDELIRLCAVDSELYARIFFPATYRQDSPAWVTDFWAPLEDPRARLVNQIAFRGSAKTTRLRIFTSKRIAYGISRTVLYIGASEEKAIQSVAWLRNQIERNGFWRDTFGLAKGAKWEETRLEVVHRTFGYTVNVLAYGVSGSLRGINLDDYRPDLIILDDPQTDDTAATEVQREKLTDLVLGAIKNSLAPEVDEPNAKLVMCITPQHKDDISQQALQDSQWVSRVFPCWTEETLDLEVGEQESSWPQRFPSAGLRAEKMAFLRRNRLSVFAREMECRLVSRETAQFQSAWLQVRGSDEPAPRGAYAVLAIDPVPPPSDVQMARGLKGKDFEAHYVWCRHEGKYHLLDYARSRGHEPSWTIATAFGLARKHRVSKIVVDAVAYQRVLKWLLDQEMRRRRIYYTIVPVADGMRKFARITNTVGNLASHGLLVIGPEHSVFAEQFEAYGPTYTGADDDLDASALALQELSNPWLERLDTTGRPIEDDVEEFPLKRVCP